MAVVRPSHLCVDAEAVRGWIAALGARPGDLDDAGFTDLDDAALVDLIRALEDLKSAASAVQARASVALDVSQRAMQRAAGVPSELLGRGVGAQVALARRESPHAGGRYLGLAKALVAEMPHTLAALSSGVLSEWRATLLVRESACLSREDRAAFDEEIAGDAAALAGLGTRALVARAKAVALRLDAASVVARARRAEAERCVTIRPAPDTMTYLTALLPVAQGVGVYAALVRAADSARAAGDPRSRGQVMADELVARIAAGGVSPVAAGGTTTGAPVGDDADNRPVTRLEVQLVMTDRTLLAGDDEPAHIPGYGTVPGAWARNAVLDALDPSGAIDRSGALDPRGARDSHGAAPPPAGRVASTSPLGRLEVWVRRLFTAPTTGQLVAMDSRSRLAPPGLANLIRARDGSCRTPYCDAPARHIDHVVPDADGGPTDAANLQAKCERCNHAKQAPGWQEGPESTEGPRGAPPVVVTTTPTGHRYASHAPALPGAPPAPGHSTQPGPAAVPAAPTHRPRRSPQTRRPRPTSTSALRRPPRSPGRP